MTRQQISCIDFRIVMLNIQDREKKKKKVSKSQALRTLVKKETVHFIQVLYITHFPFLILEI